MIMLSLNSHGCTHIPQRLMCERALSTETMLMNICITEAANIGITDCLNKYAYRFSLTENVPATSELIASKNYGPGIIC